MTRNRSIERNVSYPRSAVAKSSMLAGTFTCAGSTTPLATTRRPSQTSNRVPADRNCLGAQGARKKTCASVTDGCVPRSLTKSITRLHVSMGQRSLESSNLAVVMYRGATGSNVRPPSSGDSHLITACTDSFMEPPRSQRPLSSPAIRQTTPARRRRDSRNERISQQQGRRLLFVLLYVRRGDTTVPRTEPHVATGSPSAFPRPMQGMHAILRIPECPDTPRVIQLDRTRPWRADLSFSRAEISCFIGQS